MSLSIRGARLRPLDIQELNQASEELAAVAEQVKRANPSWTPGALALLISANNRIVAIQNRGATTFARYLEKHGLNEPPEGTETPDLDESTSAGQNAHPDEPEE